MVFLGDCDDICSATDTLKRYLTDRWPETRCFRADSPTA